MLYKHTRNIYSYFYEFDIYTNASKIISKENKIFSYSFVYVYKNDLLLKLKKYENTNDMFVFLHLKTGKFIVADEYKFFALTKKYEKI